MPDSNRSTSNNSESDSIAHMQEIVKNAEELSVTLSALLETAKSSAAAAAEHQSNAASILSELQTKLGETTAAATQAAAVKTQITDDQAVIATKSAHIQQAQEHADLVRANLDRTLPAPETAP
ncbi:MAG: hypothetical protein EHM17_05315 [Verrucomicrobiaceae bacterium]|nr:MAG: hypothetical protein EHM17_05315 [Verrucomicrobiaceae bacterium]